LDISKIAAFTDIFVICTATSSRMLNALAEAVVEKIRTEYQKKGRIEGSAEDGWMIIDYGDIIVHIFDADLRRYYNLQELWEKGKILLRIH
jgi:ribosome-associated protein